MRDDFEYDDLFRERYLHKSWGNVGREYKTLVLSVSITATGEHSFGSLYFSHVSQ